MFHVKRLLASGILAITLCPVFLAAMHHPASDDVQLNFKQAIDVCDFEKAGSCLLQGANPNMNYDAGYNLLLHYAGDGTAQQVEFLLEHGADPFHYDYFGHSALCKSIHNTVPGQAEKIILLLVKRVGVNYPISAEPKYTALHCVAQDQNIPLIELLLKLGADPNRRSDRYNHAWWGHTPLDSALRMSPALRLKDTFFPTIKLLYQYGAHAYMTDLHGHITSQQKAELKQAREQMLAFRDCGYLKQPYPYPGEDELGEDQPPYKDLYDSELLRYIPLPDPVAKLCVAYSDNALFGALVDPAVEVALAGE